MGHVFISRRLRFHMTSAWAWDMEIQAAYTSRVQRWTQNRT